MKVIDFNEEEQQIKRDIEKARQNMKDVEDLSDFDGKPDEEKITIVESDSGQLEEKVEKRRKR